MRHIDKRNFGTIFAFVSYSRPYRVIVLVSGLMTTFFFYMLERVDFLRNECECIGLQTNNVKYLFN